MTSPHAFASALLARGIELVLRKNGRLHVWPAKAYNHLSDTERAYIRDHRDELRELARTKALPETTVVWTPPSATDTPTPEAAPVPPPPCPFCKQSPCIGPEHVAFEFFHRDDPTEVKRRQQMADAVMLKMMRFGNPYR